VTYSKPGSPSSPKATPASKKGARTVTY